MHLARSVDSVAHPVVREPLWEPVAPDPVCGVRIVLRNHIERSVTYNLLCFCQQLCTTKAVGNQAVAEGRSALSFPTHLFDPRHRARMVTSGS